MSTMLPCPKKHLRGSLGATPRGVVLAAIALGLSLGSPLAWSQSPASTPAPLGGSERNLAIDAYNRGVDQAAAGNFAAAAELYEKALALDNTMAPAWNNLGTVLLRLRRLSDAIAAFKTVERLSDTPTPELLVNLAAAYHAAGEPDLALPYARRALASSALDPAQKVRALLVAAAIHSARGEHAAAVEVFEELVEAEPGHTAAWFNLGVSLSELGRLKEARKAFSQASALNPSIEATSAELHRRMGTIERALGNCKDAVSRFQRSLAIEDLPRARREMVDCLIALERYDEAAAELRKIAAEPAVAEPLELRLRLAQGMVRAGQAEAAAEHLVAYAEKVADAPARRGWDDALRGQISSAYQTLGQRQEAAGELRLAADLYRRGLDVQWAPELCRRAGDSAYRLADYPAAIAAYESLQGAAVAGGEARLAAALLARAETVLRASFAAAPAAPEAQSLEGAEQDARRAASLAPAMERAPYDLGLVLARAGRPEEALEAFSAALALRPDFRDAAYNAGLLAVAANLGDRAFSYLEVAMRGEADPARLALATFAQALAAGQAGRAPEAEALLRASGRESSDHASVVALAWVRRGADHLESGSREPARAAFARALELQRELVEAQLGIAVADLSAAADPNREAARQAVLRIAARTDLPVEVRAAAFYHVGRDLRAHGDPVQATQTLAQAADLLSRSAASEVHARGLERLRAALDGRLAIMKKYWMPPSHDPTTP
ncbi:MAG: tetratricopeptide repeat protein [Candidatus Schekmanbacteria bacterium]|nr:tetratricopeptide repeat protein [Candidatus Schekmanbacteria bacterium]